MTAKHRHEIFFFMCWYELLKKIKRSFHIALNGNSSNLLSFILWYCMITNQTTIYYQYWYLYKREQSNGSRWISCKNIQIMPDIRTDPFFKPLDKSSFHNDYRHCYYWQYAMYVHNNYWVYLQESSFSYYSFYTDISCWEEKKI